jgi:hypothetical protein
MKKETVYRWIFEIFGLVEVTRVTVEKETPGTNRR